VKIEINRDYLKDYEIDISIDEVVESVALAQDCINLDYIENCDSIRVNKELKWLKKHKLEFYNYYINDKKDEIYSIFEAYHQYNDGKIIKTKKIFIIYKSIQYSKYHQEEFNSLEINLDDNDPEYDVLGRFFYTGMVVNDSPLLIFWNDPIIIAYQISSFKELKLNKLEYIDIWNPIHFLGE
jgi:hypothetical protein